MTDQPDRSIGKWFALDEMTASPTAVRLGIDNTPTEGDKVRLENLVRLVLDQLREYLGRPIRITSGFRSDALNKAINGSPTSQHQYGQAADIKVPAYKGLPEMPPLDVARAIVALDLPYDQLIWYAPERGNFVHVSNAPTRHLRHEWLYAPAGGGGFVNWIE